MGVDSVSTRQSAVKRYIVTLSAGERERLEALIRTGKHSARKLLRARTLLKADASEAGEALTDSQIAAGLHTSLMTVHASVSNSSRKASTACSHPSARRIPPDGGSSTAPAKPS